MSPMRLMTTCRPFRKLPSVIGLIFNPAARGDKARHFRDSLDLLGDGVRVLPTRGPGDARELAAELAAADFETVVAVGGDGTVNEVLNGICDAPDGLARTRLGVIPLGTVNVFAKQMGIPEEFRAAWKVIQQGRELRIDAPLAEFTGHTGERERRHFILMAGSGLSARAVERVDWKLKTRVGPLAYVWAGLQAFRPPRPEVEVRLPDATLRAPWVEVGNGTFFGGRFIFFPRAQLDDGALDVMLLPRLSSWILAHSFLHVVTRRIARSPHVRHFQTREVTLTSAGSMPLHLDGDWVGRLPATITVRRQALRVIVP